MAQLQSTNVVGTLCVNGVAVGGGKDFKFCCFTTSTTWTPSSDLVDGGGNIETLLVGGGGGGGFIELCENNSNYCHYAIAGAGGGGEVRHKFYNIDSTDACTVTIGAGGTIGSGSWNGINTCFVYPSGKGGNTSLGSTATVYGGGGGGSAFVHQGLTACVDDSTVEGGPMGAPVTTGRIGVPSLGYVNITCYKNALTYGGGSSQPSPLPVIGISARATSNAPSYAQAGIRSCIVSSSADWAVDNLERSTIGTFASSPGYGVEDFGRGGKGVMCCAPARNEFFHGTGMTAYDSKVYGGGGHGAAAGSKEARMRATGSLGNDGIIVLKWSE